MSEKTTLNRFPLFGLFAYRAALRMGHSESAGRLLGYSTAVLYAIFKAKAQKQKESIEKGAEKKMPAEVKKAKTGTIEFGGKEFMAIYDGKRLSKTVVGHEVQTPEKYDSQVEGKFPKGWHDRLAKVFDKYLEPHTPKELNTGNTLFDLYKAWRDECKVGFNRVDLEKLVEWLKEHQEEESG
jgi:hypothetical protein